MDKQKIEDVSRFLKEISARASRELGWEAN
jgi:hypothetical protein